MRLATLLRFTLIALTIGCFASQSQAQNTRKALMSIKDLYQELDGHYNYADTIKNDDGSIIYRFGPLPLLGLPSMFEATANARGEVMDCGWLYLGPHTI